MTKGGRLLQAEGIENGSGRMSKIAINGAAEWKPEQVRTATGAADAHARGQPSLQVALDEDLAQELAREAAEEDEAIVEAEAEETPVGEESAAAKARPCPGSPTEEEIASHELLHCPHRSWCKISIKARGREDGHLQDRGKTQSDANPVIAFDYKPIGRGRKTLIVWRDAKSKSIGAHVVRCKGIGD